MFTHIVELISLSDPNHTQYAGLSLMVFDIVPVY